jgi:hypothetical protein
MRKGATFLISLIFSMALAPHASGQRDGGRELLPIMLNSKWDFMELTAQHQNYPDEFYQLPEQLRERATVIVSGTYARGRTPCFLMPDGSRVWLLESWFNIKKVYRGAVKTKSIGINTAMLPATEYVSKELERDHNYLVLLRPNEKALKKINTEEGLSFWEALRGEEIIAIVKMKTPRSKLRGIRRGRVECFHSSGPAL